MTLSNIIHRNNSSDVPVQSKKRFGRSLASLHEDMDRIIHDFFDSSDLFPSWDTRSQTPPIDIIENEKNFQVNMDLAGVNPDNIDVSVTDGYLIIKGEKEEEIKNKEGSYLYQETQYGSFQRTIPLPQSANCDKAEANFKNGILKVIVPKKSEALQTPRKVKIKKAA